MEKRHPEGSGPSGPKAGALGYTFDDATANADPGSGNLRFNAEVFAGVTEIYVDDEEENGVDVQGLFGGWGLSDTTSLGRLWIASQSEPTVYSIFELTRVTNASGYWVFSVSPVAGSGFFSAADKLSVSLGPAPIRPGFEQIITVPDNTSAQAINNVHPNARYELEWDIDSDASGGGYPSYTLEPAGEIENQKSTLVTHDGTGSRVQDASQSIWLGTAVNTCRFSGKTTFSTGPVNNGPRRFETRSALGGLDVDADEMWQAQIESRWEDWTTPFDWLIVRGSKAHTLVAGSELRLRRVA